VSAFEILALIVAVTGSAVTAQVWSVWRDRASLKLDFGVTTSTSEPPQVWLGVRNDGRQPITVREAGFYGSERPVEIDSQDLGKLRGTAEYTFKLSKGEPVLLDPGRYHEFRGPPPDAVGCGYHVDFPLRAYAVDVRGRRVWGNAAPITRIILGGGDCPPNFPAYLWNETKKPLEPARVLPKWELWVRRELRRGDRGRPSADDLIEATGTS